MRDSWALYWLSLMGRSFSGKATRTFAQVSVLTRLLVWHIFTHGWCSRVAGVGFSIDSNEFNPQSFIVKVWLEEAAGETGPAVWRGSITHVSSGKRRYLKDLDEIRAFIVPYLEAMGVKLEKH